MIRLWRCSMTFMATRTKLKTWREWKLTSSLNFNKPKSKSVKPLSSLKVPWWMHLSPRMFARWLAHRLEKKDLVRASRTDDLQFHFISHLN